MSVKIENTTVSMPQNKTALEALELYSSIVRAIQIGFSTIDTIVQRLDSSSFNSYGIYVGNVQCATETPPPEPSPDDSDSDTCTWHSNSLHSSNAYDTECGHTYTQDYTLEAIKDNWLNTKNCDWCGKRIKVVL